MTNYIFQHRHYRYIAAIIAMLPETIREPVAEAFADRLKSTNPNYDRARFMAAAMGKPSKKDTQ